MEQVNPRGFQRWKHGRRNPPILMLGVVALWLAPLLFGQVADDPREYQVKAAFLLNFTKFIEWPPAAFEQPDSPISICILGDDPFRSSLDAIVSGEVVNGRKVVVQKMKRAPSPQSCQVLFVGKSEKDVLKILPGLGWES